MLPLEHYLAALSPAESESIISNDSEHCR